VCVVCVFVCCVRFCGFRFRLLFLVFWVCVYVVFLRVVFVFV